MGTFSGVLWIIVTRGCYRRDSEPRRMRSIQRVYRLEELAVPGYCIQRAENVYIEGSRNPSNLQHQEGAAPFATITATPTREGGGFAEK